MLKKEFIFGIFILLINIIHSQSKENWVQPNAWHRHSKLSNDNSNDIDSNDVIEKNCNCPPTTITENLNDEEKITCPKSLEAINEQISLTYYKKLLKLLFHKSKLEEHDGSYGRTIEFEINEDQLNILTNSVDPRDWDPVVTEIFRTIKTQSRFVKFIENEEYKILSTLNWIKNFVLSFLSDPTMQFGLFAGLFILIVIYFSAKYNYGFLGMFLIVSVGVGYIFTYLDCNRNLQIEELASLWDSNKDPCENLQINQNWSIWNMFSARSTKEQCIEYLKQKHHTKLPFCRPFDVFLIFMTEKILNQFQLIVEKSTSVFQTSIGKFPFPYNIIAIGIFGCLLPLFIKMVFTHILDLRIWFNRNSTEPTRNADAAQKAIEFENKNKIQSILNTLTSGIEVLQSKNIEKIKNNGNEKELILRKTKPGNINLKIETQITVIENDAKNNEIDEGFEIISENVPNINTTTIGHDKSE